MYIEFVVHAKCTIFGLKRVVRKDFEIYKPNFPKRICFPRRRHLCEATKALLSIYFDRYQVLRNTLCKIQHIEIKMYP